MMKRDFLKLSATSIMAAPFTSSGASAQQEEDQIAIRWLGGATMEIRIGELNFLTDPCFGEGPEAFLMPDPNEQFDPAQGPTVRTHSRLTKFPGLSSDTYDAVLLSHAHEDHFDETAKSWMSGSMPLVCPEHDASQLREGGFDAQPLSHGENRTFYRGSTLVTIVAIPANHSPNPSVAGFLGDGNGYFIQAVVGRSVKLYYWAGDTFLTPDVAAALADFPEPDLLIPHVGAVGMTGSLGPLSLTGEQAVDMARSLGARRVLPVHHSTFSLYQEPVDAVIEAHQATGSEFELSVLSEGETLAL